MGSGAGLVAGGGVPGGGGKAAASALTVMITLAGAELACASATTSEKISVAAGEPAGTAGAVKDGCAVSAPARVTEAPDDCVQANERASPSGSALPRPSRVTEAAEATDWS